MRASDRSFLVALAAAALCTTAGAAATAPQSCVSIYSKGVLELPFNPALLNIVSVEGVDGAQTDALLMSSFYNAVKNPEGTKVERFTQRDLSAWIADIGAVDARKFDASRQLEILTDRSGPPHLAVWPNKTQLLPKGMLPFNAVAVPGGFLSADKPGRLSLVNIDDPARGEYVVAEAGTATPSCKDGRIENDQWYYHQVKFHDMDGDGLDDIVTVRGSFKPFMHKCPPTGELLYFRNPGKALQPNVEWEARVLIGLPLESGGPEINLDMADLEGDGIPEIIATHFFTSDHISVFGAPAGMPWSAVDPAAGKPVRRAVAMSGQGRPFAVQAVDLNRDGRLDILTSNHQGDGCFDLTRDTIPGRVLALEPPASGRIFEDAWTTHILKDNIRPHPTFPAPARAPGRLAPNRALAFWPERAMEQSSRPWITVAGDEASKVWVLKPRSAGKDDWSYESFVVFDINEHYGANASQTLMQDPQGVSISTIGGLTWRYDRPGPDGRAEIYAPVFEARDIHIFSFRDGSGEPVRCTADTTIACPAPSAQR